MKEILAKKLLYQSKNRGCKETDLILGAFAEEYLDGMNMLQLEEYQKILKLYDGDLYNYISKKSPVPSEFDTPIMKNLLEFKLKLAR